MDWNLIEEFFKNTGLSITLFLVVVGIFYVLINLVRVMIYEKKIEGIEKKKQKEIDNLKKHTGMTITFFEASVKKIKDEYQADLDNFHRRRNFILDRIPFFKK